MTEEPKYLMRFVGFKEDGSGELKRTSPSGIKQHELRMLPFDYSLSIWWELVDDIPDLKVPEVEAKDSVYEEETPYLAWGRGGPCPVCGVLAPPLVVADLDAWTTWTFEHMKEHAEAEDGVYVEEERLKYILPIEGDPADVEVIHYEGMTVKSLKLFIEQRGGKVDSEWLKADLVREARELEEASRAASESS